jgi:hypothetical protein
VLRTVLTLTAVLGAIVSAGCGGASRDNDLRQALRSANKRDLAVMVLPKSALGKEFAALEVAAYSDPLGYSSNAQEAPSDTIDPKQTGATLSDAGRVIGYDLTYGHPDLAAALKRRRGVVFVKTSVDLFTDDGSAGRYVEKTGRDYQVLAGRNLGGGSKIDQVESFRVEEVGHEAIGRRARITSSGVQLFGTVIMFHLGRLVGFASVARADRENEDERVESLARALATRIEAVLLGEIKERPVPLLPRE